MDPVRAIGWRGGRGLRGPRVRVTRSSRPQRVLILRQRVRLVIANRKVKVYRPLAQRAAQGRGAIPWEVPGIQRERERMGRERETGGRVPP